MSPKSPFAARLTTAPAYGWRGLSIDVARRFFPVNDLIRAMDMAASFELNRFHLHLSDDQGWRLDVPGWPELVERSSGSGVDGGPGGFYSRADWALLKRSATERGLTLIPEFDLPGHTNAALHAIPGLNPDGNAPEVYEGIDVGFSSLRLGAPETERFITEVLRFATDISDGLVHVGGDESHSTEAAEYAELMGLITGAVRDAGGTIIAWQEAADYLVAGEYTQVWDERLKTEPIVAAAERGVNVILSPASRVYLDMKYTNDTELGLTWMGTNELEHAADWRPAELIPGLDPERIAGVEATIWTETIKNFDQLSYMLLPRLAAAAEMAWRSEIDWPTFAGDLPELARYWDAQGWKWHRSPGVDW